MANTNNLVKFLTGSESVLSGTSAPAKVPGQILFAIEEKTNQPPRGYIYFDKDNNTRIRMSEHATTAETDINGKEITSYVASIEVSGTTLKYKNANGDVIDTLTLQDKNTDTKVTNTASTTETKIYITGTKTASTNTGTQFFSSSIYLDAKDNKIIAPTFVGALTGNADSATLATRAVGDESGASIKSYIKDITTQPTNHKMVVKNGNGDVINATTTTLPFVLQAGDTMTGNLTISNSDPSLKIVNTGTGAASLELQRTGASTAGWKFLNSAGTLHIQNDYTTTKGNYFDVMTLAFNTGNAVFKGTITANNGVVSATPTLIGTASRAVADKNGGEITTKYVKYDTIVVDPDAHSLNYQNGAGDTLDTPISLPFVKLSGDTVEGTLNVTELNAGNLIVSGAGRFANGLYGSLTGNADTATRATEDEGGTNIRAGYAHSLTLSGQTLTLKSGGGDNLSTVTFTTANGGTGHAGNYTAKGIIFATSATEFASTAAGTAGYLLQGNGASNDPSWIQATDANTASTIIKRDANGDFSAGIITATLNGTASNANNLLQNTRMDYGWNGVNYFNIETTNQSKAKVNDTPSSASTWWHILRFNHLNNTGYYTDLAVPFNANSLHYKRINGGTLQNSTTNGGWVQVLDQLNYNNYAPTKTGTGASGTWGISVTGNAGTATKFNSARSITLTGDVTGSASSDGASGWSIVTTVGDDTHNHTMNTIVPIAARTYSGIIASANDAANGIFVYATVRPTTWDAQWYVRYKMRAHVPGQTAYDQYSTVEFFGYRDVLNFSIYNSQGVYICYHNHQVYRLKAAGFNAGYGHALAARIYSASQPTATAYARTFDFELFETNNCEVTFLDSMTLYSAIAGTGTTNYNTTYEISYSNGLQETGDTNDISTQRAYYTHLIAGTNGIRQYSLVMMDSSHEWQSFTTNSGVGTSKTRNTTGFIPGRMFYHNGGDVAANAVTGNSTVTERQNLIDLRYSTNCGTTLTANAPVYIVGTMSNGLFYLDATWWTQTEPISADNKVYIPIGIAYNTYQMDFMGYQGMYYYNGTNFVQYMESNSAINDANGNSITSTYLKKSGDTATGPITVSKAGEIGLYAYNSTANHQVGLVAGASGAGGVWDPTNSKWIVYSDINGNVTLNGNANTATTATTATTALRVSGVAGVLNADRHIWFSDSAAETARNYDDDFKYNPATNTLTVANVSGTATKANQDGDGNTINSTYAKLSGATFTGIVTGTHYISTAKMTLTSSRIAEILTAPCGGLFADGVAFSNPTTKNDQGWIRVLGTGESDTVFEIATGDDGGHATSGEEIKVRQYQGSNLIPHEVTLLDKTGNTAISGSLTIGSSTTDAADTVKLVMDKELDVLNFVFV